YAALVVEDSSASIDDDHGGRDWEVLISQNPGVPSVEALDQRVHDMMGRNWEEAFATARRMVALYPDDPRAWLRLRTFQGWVGLGEDDSVLAVHRARVAAFDTQLVRRATLSGAELGYFAQYASQVDSATAHRWRARLLREAPTNSFAVQLRLIDVFDELSRTSDTTAAMRRLETLWSVAPADRLGQIASVATPLSYGAGDGGVMWRWTERLVQS